MSEWKTGDVITAERLNGMKTLVVHYTPTGEATATCNCTIQEIIDAINNGVALYAVIERDGTFDVFHLTQYGISEDEIEIFWAYPPSGQSVTKIVHGLYDGTESIELTN